MDIGVFSVFDSKAGAYLQPFYERNCATAMRSFEVAVNDPSSNFHKFAADYTLFEIGRWDEGVGVIEMHEAKYQVCNALEVLKSEGAALEVVK